MESLLAYNSSSDEESDRTTKYEENFKKGKVKLPGTDQGKDQEIKDVCATESGIQTCNNQMGSFLEPRNAIGLNECSYSKSKQTYLRNDHGSIVLPRTFSEPQFPMGFSNQEKKSPAFNSSLTQYKHSNSSSTSGRRVKPYISKREREKLAQTALPGSSSSLKRQLHVALEKSNFDHTINEVDLQPNRPCEISDGKHLAHACRPPKHLHLNFEGHSQAVNCVYWNPTRGNLLLSAAMDHLVCVWDISCGSTCCRRLTHHTAAVKDSKWSLCGEKILSCGYDKTARLSNLETGQEIIKFPHKNFATCVQFHPTDPALFLSGTFKSAILCWDTRTGNITSTYSALFGQVQDIAFLPGGDEFVSAAEVVKRNSTDKGIMVWDFRSTAILSNQIYQEAFTCTCLKVHPHEAHFVAQSNGDYIALFSTRKPYKLNKFKRYEGHKVNGYHIGCDFSPDGSIITSGSADGQINFYDHHTSHMVRTLQAHSMPCMDVAFHPTLPNCVASCGWEGQVKVWK